MWPLAQLVKVRLIQRVMSWEDSILSFQLLVTLLALSVLLLIVGYFASLLPWGLLWEWAFRILGAAIFGPHMHWVGAAKRKEWEAFKQQSEWFESVATSEEKRSLLDEHRQRCKEVVEEMVRLEMDPADPPEVRTPRRPSHMPAHATSPS